MMASVACKTETAACRSTHLKVMMEDHLLIEGCQSDGTHHRMDGHETVGGRR